MTPSFDEIVEFARQLRDAGVLAIEMPGGLKMSFAEKYPDLEPAKREYVQPEPTDAMKDPETYGLPPGSPIPGFERLRSRSGPVEDDDEADE